MLPKSPSMSSYEGDSDEELPCVSLSQSTGGKSELEMPPASEVASLRAREDAAERALKDLRDSCNDPLLISLSRSASQGSSGEEGEAALSAAVSALQVTEQPGTPGLKDHLQLLTAMRDNLPVESPILNEYIRVFMEKPERAGAVTEVLLRGVSSSVISGRAPSDIGVCVCALCAALRGRTLGRRGCRARRALHALLDAHADVRVLATAVSAAVEDAEELLAAHDAVRNGGRGGADRLAAALLAQAMARVLSTQDASPHTDPPSPLSPESVTLVRSSWRKLPTRSQLTLLRCAGRALAAAGDFGDNWETEDNADMEHMSVIDTETMKEDTRTADGTEGTMATEIIEGSKTTGETESTMAVEREGGAVMDTESIEASKTTGDTESTRPVEREGGAAMATKSIEGSKTTGGTESTRAVEREDGAAIATESIEGSKTAGDTESTRAVEREGGAALLAALNQPLPRASAFHIDRQQVLTNVSKLQLLFRSRYVPDSENDVLAETHFNCSQNSMDESIDTPIKLDTPIKEETPIKQETKNILTPVNFEMKVKIPMKQVTPMKLDNLLKMPGKIGTHIKDSMNDTLTKYPIVTPVKGTLKAGTQLKLDGFFKQITPVKVESEEECSPDRKRARRERRYPQRSGKS